MKNEKVLALDSFHQVLFEGILQVCVSLCSVLTKYNQRGHQLQELNFYLRAPAQRQNFLFSAAF